MKFYHVNTFNMKESAKNALYAKYNEIMASYREIFPDAGGPIVLDDPFYDYGNSEIRTGFYVSANFEPYDLLSERDSELLRSLTSSSVFRSRTKASTLFFTGSLVEKIGTDESFVTRMKLAVTTKDQGMISVELRSTSEDTVIGLKDILSDRFVELVKIAIYSMSYHPAKEFPSEKLSSETSFIGIGSASSINVNERSVSRYDVNPLIDRFGKEKATSMITENMAFRTGGGRKLEISEDGILTYGDVQSITYD